MIAISIEILGINFGKSIPEISKWDKISEGIYSKKSICGTE